MTRDPFQDWRRQFSSSMSAKGITVKLNTPPAPESIGEGLDEFVQSLPPYEERPAFYVDDYPSCPDQWLRSTDEQSCWFVPVIAEPPRHLWLDFNSTFNLGHHAAVLPSIQGVNALTATQAARRLEQYRHNCPIHNIPFGANRLCEKCGYEWPPQNYLATTAQPHGFMWLDGFRTGDGVVRGFLLTTQTDRGIATQILGDERTHSIGLAVYLSKEPKPRPVYTTRRGEYLSYGDYAFKTLSASQTRGITSSTSRSYSASRGAELESVEIGAGAKINQRIERDPNDISFWRETPEATFIIYYVPAQIAWDIIQRGKRERIADGEGPLKGLKTGHHPRSPFREE